MEANSEYKGWLEIVIKWHDLTLSLLHMQLGVGDPNPPIRGFIEGFDSAVEGATIHYSCRPGLVPMAQMRAACTNMSWSPDPATLKCREPRPGKVTDCNAGKLW